MNLRLPYLAARTLLVSGWLLAGGTAVHADVLPEPTDARVLDLAEVLDPTAEARIERLLTEIEATSGVTMEVVIMTDIADHGGVGERLDGFATKLFEGWAIGAPERNDGILILVTTDTAEARIALGADYPAVYETRAARVLSTAVLPELREGRIATGIEAGVLSARDRLITPFLAGLPVTATEGFETAARPMPQGLTYSLLAVGVLGLVGWLVWRNARKKRTCPSCGAVSLTRTYEEIEPATAQSLGTGIEHMLCGNCGFTDRRSYIVKRGLAGTRRQAIRR